MKKFLYCFLMLCIFQIGITQAQDGQVRGKVTSATNDVPISGVSVRVVGQTTASQTDASGNYQISINAGAKELTFSYLGYKTTKVTIGNKSSINVKLAPDSESLDEVVVTALGISREKKSLGYASQEVKGDELTAARGGNALQSLSGNVAGAVVNSPSSSLGGSTRIILRGIGSVTGENRPLIVIDGIPMDNSNYNDVATQRGAGGRDYGDTGFDINPDDIESINVLKGGPASALYGARAANGVLLIKTKRAQFGRDEIIFNTGLAMETLGITPSLQKLYGGGFESDFAKQMIDGKEYQLVDYSADESWGPKLDGQNVLHWDAFDPMDTENYLVERPWAYPKDDYRSFFNTGVGYTNSISLAKSYEHIAARASLSNMSQTGIVPNSNLKRTSAALSLESKFADKLTVRGNINYIRTDGFNRPEQGYGGNSIVQKMFQWGQVQLDYSRLKKYKTALGDQITWNRRAWNDANPAFSDNFYWTINENTSNDHRDRFYGNLEFKYDILPGLYATANIYGDNYFSTISEQVAIGSQTVSQYKEDLRSFTEMNYEARVHFDKTWDKFSLNSFFGTNRRNNNRSESFASTAGGLIVKDLYSISNSKQTASITSSKFLKRINSLFGNASFGYDNFLYADFGFRNDWSSTLPAEHNSYFYPSVTGSFIFTRFINQDWLSFGKLRAGWSQVGNDTDPYKLLDIYENDSFGNTVYLDEPYFLKNFVKLNPNLMPEKKTSYEVGLEAQFLNNRIGLDVTYYDEQTSNLIIELSTGAETGFRGKFTNAGRTSNKGIEAMLTFVPILNDNFTWTSNINFARNKNKVVELYDNIESLNIVTAPFNVTLIAALGQPYGQIYGSDFIYDDQGDKVVGANGLYLSSDVKNLGSILPDFNAGWRNSFSYKDFSLSALIDVQKGGKYFSTSNMFGHYTGMMEATAADNVREEGLIAEGVTADVTRNLDGSYTVINSEKNDIQVSGMDYYRHFYSGPSIQNVFNADYIKLREITLGYQIPNSLLGRYFIKNATISGFARNLAAWGLDNKNYDPEMVSQGSGNIQGIEGGNLPASRSFGLNLKLQF